MSNVSQTNNFGPISTPACMHRAKTLYSQNYYKYILQNIPDLGPEVLKTNYPPLTWHFEKQTRTRPKKLLIQEYQTRTKFSLFDITNKKSNYAKINVFRMKTKIAE